MSNKWVGLISAVLVVVIGISLTGTVVDAVSDAITTATTAADQPLTVTILPFISVIYVAGVLGLAGAIGYVSLRRG
jgi:hypothetical protein